MTTIAILHPLMMSDSRGAVRNSQIVSTIPMVKHQVSACRRFAYGVSGDTPADELEIVEQLLAAYFTLSHGTVAQRARQSGAIRRKVAALGELLGDTPLLAMTRERAYRLAGGGKRAVLLTCVPSEPAAIGTGAPYLLAGVHTGLSLPEAMAFTVQHDTLSGAPFTTTHAADLVAFTADPE